MSVSSGSATILSGRSGSTSQERPEADSGVQYKDNTSSTKLQDTPGRAALRGFDSRWFLIPQGTGILAITLWHFPYRFRGLNILAIIFWVLTILQFLTTLLFYILRITKLPTYFLSLLSTNNSEVACLASIAVTLTSIVQMLGLLLGNYGWSVAVHVLWWACAGFSLLAVIGIPYVFANINPPSIAQLLPSTQLPLVAALTAAAAGGSICQGGYLSAQAQVPIILISYSLVGIAVPLAFILDTLFLSRLYNETKQSKTQQSKSQALNLAYQSLVLSGPWAQGSNALQGLGNAVLAGSFKQYKSGIMLTTEATSAVGYSSMFTGLLFWGQATFWWACTIISIAQACLFNTRGKAKFDLAAWSMVFPWGVYTHATGFLAETFDSTAFRGWTTVLTVAMLIIWLLNTALTVKGCLIGSLFGLENGWRGQSKSRREIMP